MSDNEDTTQPKPGSGDEGPSRDTTSGRYVGRQESGGDGDKGDDKKDEQEGKKRWLLLLLLLLILLLLLCAGFAYMRWWKKDEPKTPTATPTGISTTQTVKPTPTPTPTPSITPSASPSPTVSPSPKTVAMPNVVGKPAAEAKTILEAAGLTNIKFVDEANQNLNLLVSFVVTKQSVAPGTQIPVDTAVVITCKTSSNGKG